MGIHRADQNVPTSHYDVVQQHVQRHEASAREDRQRIVDIARGRLPFFDLCPDLVVGEIISHLELRDRAHLAATGRRLHHNVLAIWFQEFGANQTARSVLGSELSLHEGEALFPKFRSLQKMVDLICEHFNMPKVILNRERDFARFIEDLKYTSLCSILSTMQFSMELGGAHPIPLAINILFRSIPSKDNLLEEARGCGVKETDEVRQKIKRIYQRLTKLWEIHVQYQMTLRWKLFEALSETIVQKVMSSPKQYSSRIRTIVGEPLLVLIPQRIEGRDKRVLEKLASSLFATLRVTLTSEGVTDVESLAKEVQEGYEDLFKTNAADDASLLRLVNPQLISEHTEYAKKVLRWSQEDDASGLCKQLSIVPRPMKLWLHLDDETSPLVKLSSVDRGRIKEEIDLFCNSLFVPEELKSLPNTTVVSEEFRIPQFILAKLDEPDRAEILRYLES